MPSFLYTEVRSPGGTGVPTNTVYEYGWRLSGVAWVIELALPGEGREDIKKKVIKIKIINDLLSFWMFELFVFISHEKNLFNLKYSLLYIYLIFMSTITSDNCANTKFRKALFICKSIKI